MGSQIGQRRYEEWRLLLRQDKVFAQRLNLWVDHEGMRGIMLDPRLGKTAAELAGVDGMRIWHDQALIKEPWANPTDWHLDNPNRSFFSRNAISIWVALDDVTLHKEASFDHSGITENMSDLVKVYPQWAEREARAAPMKAGDCSFHNRLLAHGAGANMTPGRRRVCQSG